MKKTILGWVWRRWREAGLKVGSFYERIFIDRPNLSVSIRKAWGVSARLPDVGSKSY